MLTTQEQAYYTRQINLMEFGLNAQLRLKASTVFIAGAGGLGCPALLYLVGAGVGKITIADGDHVQLNNLHRQVLYGVDDIGKKKALVAAERLHSLNPNILINSISAKITADNISDLLLNIDLVIDATDNFETRFLLGDYTEKFNIPLVYAAISGFEGQLTVFNYFNGIAFRDLYPEEVRVNSSADCAINGVVGYVPGIMGCLQAAEAIKIITSVGSVMSGKLLAINLLTLEKREIVINPLNKEKNSETRNLNNNNMISEINSNELKERIDRVFLLDVREPHEYSNYNIGGILIPLRELPERLSEIPKEKDIVVICESGVRSFHAAQYISKIYSETKVFNLKGGLRSWRG